MRSNDRKALSCPAGDQEGAGGQAVYDRVSEEKRAPNGIFGPTCPGCSSCTQTKLIIRVNEIKTHQEIPSLFLWAEKKK